jgi:hypothetical protein
MVFKSCPGLLEVEESEKKRRGTGGVLRSGDRSGAESAFLVAGSWGFPKKRVRPSDGVVFHFSEGLPANDFHFMRYVRCLYVGVDCLGYGEVMVKIQAVPRISG